MMQISTKDLKARLVSFAREIGFDFCRVAPCNVPAHANDFREWLRDGAHGEMYYMQRGEEKRCDPEKILPDAQSIVALALNYFQLERTHRRSETAATGRIARYAWGDDYHDVIGAKLNRIDEFFRSDDCLEACPWNRFAQESRESAFCARRSTNGMLLREYLDLTDAEFRALFTKSPIERIKRRGFLRNVCVALGNVGDPSDLPALERAAADPEPLIAEHAMWAIQRIRERIREPRPKLC